MAQSRTSSISSDELPILSLAMPGDYIQLLKPRVMSLVVFTALVGLLMAPGSISPFFGAIAILCISIGAGASGALNMWYDADIDAVMPRTAARPIPAGKIEARQALAFGLVLSAFSAFGLVLSAFSVMIMGLLINWFSASLLAFTIFFYAVIYTMWLKRSTPQNIVIGGAAGAFPPMIGWAAVTGSISIESVVLFAIIFIWTPPHFWALALFRRGDYEKAGIPMMPNIRGDASTRIQILIYSLVLAPVGVLPFMLGFAGPAYGVFAGILGAVFVYFAWSVWHNQNTAGTHRDEKRLFGFSILYLFAIFGALGVDAVTTRIMG